MVTGTKETTRSINAAASAANQVWRDFFAVATAASVTDRDKRESNERKQCDVCSGRKANDSHDFS